MTTLVYAISGGQAPYRVTVDGRPVETASEPNHISCRVSALWTLIGPHGDDGIQRIVVSVSDAAGARAYGVAEHRLVRPLPAPSSLQVTSDLTWSSELTLSAEWWTPFLPRERRTREFAIRWRVEGSADWTVEHLRGVEQPVFRFRKTWPIDAPPIGERREVQIAQLRHILDLQAPQALRWSASAFVTTAAYPHELQADATHNMITLSWGPQATGLDYVARLNPVFPAGYRDGLTVRVKGGPVYQARFDDLLPDTLYRVEVARDSRQPLEQHQFELRTEPAPEGWSAPTRSATDIEAAYVDGEVEVTWTPPEVGSRYETEVCASPSHITYWTCQGVAPGEARASLSRDSDEWRGGSYQVMVSVKTAPAARAIQRFHIPTYEPDLPTRGGPPPAPRFAEVDWFLHPDHPSPGTWTFEWDAVDGDLAEVLWRIGDEWFHREHRVSAYNKEMLRIATKARAQPEAVSYRILRARVWTPWSSPTDAPDVTSSLWISGVDEYQDHLRVYWEPPGRASDIDGYRLYVRRNHGPAEAIEVGPEVHAVVPIRERDRWYEMHVAALTAEHGEVIQGYGYRYERSPLSLHLDQTAGSWCQPVPHDRVRVSWIVGGGAAPFMISIGNLLGFETDRRSGSTVVECDWGPNRAVALVSAAVRDAHGDTAFTNRDYSYAPYHWEDPSSDPPVYLRRRSVHRDRVLLSWSCNDWTNRAALRWRVEGEPEWRYVADLPRSTEGDWRCRAVKGGLEPLTTYEYQLARFDPHEEVRRLEQLNWTDTQTVTTLGPPEGLVITRDGATVTLTWQRQPEAWAYVVGLRADGRSWWKRYEPSGEATEQIQFYRIPAGHALSVELISPPLENGEEARPRGYDIDGSWFHE
ncbi:MAG: hypothetical protein OXT70_12840 [Chloroflexota bacterium]|nr:hypothetical protein [Chloroflexota bacterium]